MRGVSHGHHVARTEHMNRPRRPDLGWIKKDATLSVPVLQQVRQEVLSQAGVDVRRRRTVKG